jgi:hypothetical protein
VWGDAEQVLLRHGARTSDTDSEGKTALWYVPEHAAALRLLLSGEIKKTRKVKKKKRTSLR